ncbi:hypothetical protein HDU93_003303 [Gonapodya sp. JEL0774]|nr:hypothetical protein HDU93_003303 [Gonapodya sp. JEL0774]
MSIPSPTSVTLSSGMFNLANMQGMGPGGMGMPQLMQGGGQMPGLGGQFGVMSGLQGMGGLGQLSNIGGMGQDDLFRMDESGNVRPGSFQARPQMSMSGGRPMGQGQPGTPNPYPGPHQMQPRGPYQNGPGGPGPGRPTMQGYPGPGGPPPQYGRPNHMIDTFRGPPTMGPPMGRQMGMPPGMPGMPPGMPPNMMGMGMPGMMPMGPGGPGGPGKKKKRRKGDDDEDYIDGVTDITATKKPARKAQYMYGGRRDETEEEDEGDGQDEDETESEDGDPEGRKRKKTASSGPPEAQPPPVTITRTGRKVVRPAETSLAIGNLGEDSEYVNVRGRGRGSGLRGRGRGGRGGRGGTRREIGAAAKENGPTPAIFCQVCHRGHSPLHNRIVLCDSCENGWHQMCAEPKVPDGVVEDDNAPWLCTSCVDRNAKISRGEAVEPLIKRLDREQVESKDGVDVTAWLPQDHPPRIMVHGFCVTCGTEVTDGPFGTKDLTLQIRNMEGERSISLEHPSNVVRSRSDSSTPATPQTPPRVSDEELTEEISSIAAVRDLNRMWEAEMQKKEDSIKALPPMDRLKGRLCHLCRGDLESREKLLQVLPPQVLVNMLLQACVRYSEVDDGISKVYGAIQDHHLELHPGAAPLDPSADSQAFLWTANDTDPSKLQYDIFEGNLLRPPYPGITDEDLELAIAERIREEKRQAMVSARGRGRGGGRGRPRGGRGRGRGRGFSNAREMSPDDEHSEDARSRTESAESDDDRKDDD